MLRGNLWLVLWATAATIYIAHDVWSDFRERTLEAARKEAHKAGHSDAFREVVKAGSQCTPFTVSIDDKKVELTSVECARRGAVPSTFPPGLPALPAGVMPPGKGRSEAGNQ